MIWTCFHSGNLEHCPIWYRYALSLWPKLDLLYLQLVYFPVYYRKFLPFQQFSFCLFSCYSQAVPAPFCATSESRHVEMQIHRTLIQERLFFLYSYRHVWVRANSCVKSADLECGWKDNYIALKEWKIYHSSTESAITLVCLLLLYNKWKLNQGSLSLNETKVKAFFNFHLL